MSRSCTWCAHWRTDGFCLSVTRPYKIAWMFLWNGLHTVQLLCVHTSKVSEQFSEINRILSWLSFYGICVCIFTSSKKKNMKHSLQLWQRIRGLIKDHYRVAFCQLLFESRVSQIFYYLKYVQKIQLLVIKTVARLSESTFWNLSQFIVLFSINRSHAGW